ncbi:methionyl-tRNA formyltransferase [Methylobacillus gramineus]|uniref:methionyl-tRNA formyltransferase n=1 Tax=Methylobacillus gramineus TaxID=755169 RepID=UPI001CFF6D18|nr:methionyl-tRNA formyltransferase [Methylobacillus gramineus]MCB5185540.1 methionyl-tRNA formyltransferase [Methylobacillus gramineus]
MKIIFAGTPEFAVPALDALIASSHEVSLVLTQPDRPAGRGMKLRPSPVKELALQYDIAVFQPETLKDEAVQARIAAENVDAMVVAAYGLIIPTKVLGMPSHGCFNIHASLLPRWRGAAPIQRSLLAGDTETGVTIMEVVPALDAGAMISKGILSITDRDTAQTLHDGLASIGAALMVQAMDQLQASGRLQAEPQDEALVTYAEKLNKAEAAIDWNQSAEALSRQVRAFNPFPVAQSLLHGEVCRIWMAQALPGSATPGEIVALGDAIAVGCASGLLRIEELQMPGGKRLKARDFLAGRVLSIGERFGL